jgi:hypothetical protein
MTRRLISTALAATLFLIPLQGCATVAAASQAAPVIAKVAQVANKPVDKVFPTLADEKAYYGLLRFEKSANELAIAAVDMGFLTAGSPTAVQAADLLKKLTAISEAAKRAKALGDAASIGAKVAEGKALYGDIMKLLGR